MQEIRGYNIDTLDRYSIRNSLWKSHHLQFRGLKLWISVHWSKIITRYTKSENHFVAPSIWMRETIWYRLPYCRGESISVTSCVSIFTIYISFCLNKSKLYYFVEVEDKNYCWNVQLLPIFEFTWYSIYPPSWLINTKLKGYSMR